MSTVERSGAEILVESLIAKGVEFVFGYPGGAVLPIYDALFDFMEARSVERGLQTGMIEIAPLAFMRGRTLSKAVVLLDEAQNCTPMQMKMFLTRLGEGSRMIITGDPTQIDLPPGLDPHEAKAAAGGTA